MPTNIDDFNRGTALILAQLYRTFPVPCVIKVAELDDHADLVGDDVERRDGRHAIYAAAIDFLAEEGYLRHRARSSGGEVFSRVVLTSKGLAALQRTPEVLDAPRKTVGDRLLEATRTSATEAAKEIIRQALRLVFS
ncbi:MAG: hypothetical protein ACREF9_14310 [Opitutaceae bacterium]